MIMLYCSAIPETKDTSAAHYEAQRRHPWARCRGTYEDEVRGRKSSNRVVAETIKTRRKMKESRLNVRVWAEGVVLQEGERYRAKQPLFSQSIV